MSVGVVQKTGTVKRALRDAPERLPLTSAIKQYIMLPMKTTLDIPDALYRRFKMKTTQNGETVRNATLAFIASYVNGRAVGVDVNGIPQEPAKTGAEPELPAWAGLAAPYIRDHADGPHDMASIRRSMAKARRGERRT